MKIKYDLEKGILFVDGKEYEGNITDPAGCRKCKGPLVYSDHFDATLCPSCNEWKESACSDPSCKYCSARPEKPIKNPEV
ncbi:hypothetical protein GCM10009865_36880 [Aeromicrobium ponti]